MIRRMSMSTGRGAEPATGLALLAPAITHFFRMWTETISGRMSFSPAWKPGRSRSAMVLLRSGSSVGMVDTERWRRGSKSSSSCWNGSTPRR